MDVVGGGVGVAEGGTVVFTMMVYVENSVRVIFRELLVIGIDVYIGTPL